MRSTTRRVRAWLRAMAPNDQDVITDLVKVYRSIREFDKAITLLLELEQIAPQRKREIYTQIAEIKPDARQDDQRGEQAGRGEEPRTRIGAWTHGHGTATRGRAPP